MNRVKKILFIAIIGVGLITSYIIIKAVKNTFARNYADKGENFLMVNNHESALRLFEKSLSLNPNSINVEFKLFDQYVGLKKYDLAIELLKKQLKRCPDELWDFQRYGKLGKLYLQLEDYNDAKALYTIVAKKDSKAPLGFLGLANVSEKKGDISEAIKYQEQAIYIMKNYYRDFPQSKIKSEEQKLLQLYKRKNKVDVPE